MENLKAIETAVLITMLTAHTSFYGTIISQRSRDRKATIRRLQATIRELQDEIRSRGEKIPDIPAINSR